MAIAIDGNIVIWVPMGGLSDDQKFQFPSLKQLQHAKASYSWRVEPRYYLRSPHCTVRSDGLRLAVSFDLRSETFSFDLLGVNIRRLMSPR